METTENIPFLLRVSCMTYNHSAFIVEAMNGFVMQQTDFPYVCTVIDDASTDGEQEVIRQYVNENFDMQDTDLAYDRDEDYGHVTFARNKSNRNCHFAVIYLKENHFSQNKAKDPYIREWLNPKYQAICEGDDYWTDPLKLQKQVDFLESHPDYSMCFHSATALRHGVESPFPFPKFGQVEDREYGPTEVFLNWIVPTASIVFRKHLVTSRRTKRSDWLLFGDIDLILKCMATGKVWGMSDVMSVYRLHPDSITHKDEFTSKEVFRFPNHFKCIYINYPDIDPASIKWIIARSYSRRMRQQKNPFLFIADCFRTVYWSPKYVIRKFGNLFRLHQ